MASITIHNFDDGLKSRLHIQAAIHGRSMEDEERDILLSVLSRPPQSAPNLAAAIHGRFAALGDAELSLAPRETLRGPTAFD